MIEKLKPMISVIVPCYNQGEYLSETLQSVLNQTYVNWECVIVNDGSPDNTEEIAVSWTKKDSRFIYLSIKNGGLSNARNVGIYAAKGTYILPLDSDDKIAPKYMSLAMNEFVKDSELKLVYSEAEKFGKGTGIKESRPFTLSNLTRYNMFFCTSFFKKSDWMLIGGYDTKMIYGLEDWEFWIGLLKNGGGVSKLNYVGFFYRTNDMSMSASLSQSKKEEMLKYMSIKHADFYVKELGSFYKWEKKHRKSEQKYNKLINSKRELVKLFINMFFRLKK